eukprot:2822238-Pyramimonas_sp.AAC.2
MAAWQEACTKKPPLIFRSSGAPVSFRHTKHDDWPSPSDLLPSASSAPWPPLPPPRRRLGGTFGPLDAAPSSPLMSDIANALLQTLPVWQIGVKDQTSLNA